MDWKGFLVVLVCLLAWAIVADAQEPNQPPEITLDAHWSVEGGVGLGAAGQDLLRGSALYWPAYDDGDGAIGIAVIGGDMIPEDECAAGPTVEFPTGDIYREAANRVLPDPWAAAFADLVADVRPYGTLTCYFDYDFDPIIAAGTAIRLWPNKHLQPTLHTEWMSPAGNSSLDAFQGWWTTFTVAFFF